MDLKQKKLTSKEWLYLEKPIQKKEQKILEFIYNSYFNVNEKINNTNTLLAFTKLNDLLQSGVLTKEEFEKAKKKILDN